MTTVPPAAVGGTVARVGRRTPPAGPAAAPDAVPCPPAVARLVGPGVVVLALAVAAAVALLRLVTGHDLAAVGPALLVTAVVAGMPHGALDTALVQPAGSPLRARAAAGAAYLGVAAVVYLAWLRWPAAAVVVLLVVSAAHFAAADHTTARWRRPVSTTPRADRVLAATSGALAVAGPFAWWPSRTVPLLDHLHAAASAPVVTAASRVVVATALLVAVAAAAVTARAGRPAAEAEPLAVAALTAAAPPLVAFAVYFAGWHSVRQTARLLAVHPDVAGELRRNGLPRAVRTLVRAAAVPTAVALVLLVALAWRPTGVPAALLAALLAVSVPHAAVGAWRERGGG